MSTRAKRQKSQIETDKDKNVERYIVPLAITSVTKKCIRKAYFEEKWECPVVEVRAY